MARKRSAVALIGWFLAAPATAAPPWSNEVSPTIGVHGHTFNKVRIDAEGCNITLKLWFDAPKEGYADPKNRVRNHYRFVAKIQMKDGRSFETKVFANRDAGRRLYTTTIDTGTDGCWSTAQSQIVKLDVNACRGERCRVEPFED